MAIIYYPPNINTDRKKLYAVYSILEQMRVEHNRQYEVYMDSEGVVTERQWLIYIQIFRSKQLPLLQEQNRLRLAIRQAMYDDIEWGVLGHIDNDVAFQAVLKALWGDKEKEKVKPTNATSDLLDELMAIDLITL